MNATASRSRQPKGVSTGGQFAAEHRPEASGVTLSSAQQATPELNPSQMDRGDYVKAYVEANYVDPHPDLKGTDRVVLECGNCAGTGLYEGRSNVKFATATVGGLETTGCFACMGHGKVSRRVSSIRASERRQVRHQGESIWDAADFQSRRGQMLADQAPMRQALEQMRQTVPQRAWPDSLWFILNELEKDPERVLAESEARRVHALAEKVLAERAQMTPVPATGGRQQVTGKVVSTRWDAPMYPGGTATKKMLLDCGGYRLWGTAPSGHGIEVGDTVSFQARLEVSDDDESFGFFKRPTRTEVTERAPEDDPEQPQG